MHAAMLPSPSSIGRPRPAWGSRRTVGSPSRAPPPLGHRTRSSPGSLLRLLNGPEMPSRRRRASAACSRRWPSLSCSRGVSCKRPGGPPADPLPPAQLPGESVPPSPPPSRCHVVEPSHEIPVRPRAEVQCACILPVRALEHWQRAARVLGVLGVDLRSQSAYRSDRLLVRGETPPPPTGCGQIPARNNSAARRNLARARWRSLGGTAPGESACCPARAPGARRRSTVPTTGASDGLTRVMFLTFLI